MSIPAQRPPGVDDATWAATVHNGCQNGVFRRIIGDLAPKFLNDPTQVPLARGMALHAVMSYLPEEDADWFSAADVVSFSLASLDLLKDATVLEMSPAMKLRFVGRAIQASRMARDAETMLQKRRKEREAMSPERVRRIRDPLGLSPVPEQPPARAMTSEAWAEMTAELERRLRESEAWVAADDPPADVERPASTPAAADPAWAELERRLRETGAWLAADEPPNEVQQAVGTPAMVEPACARAAVDHVATPGRTAADNRATPGAPAEDNAPAWAAAAEASPHGQAAAPAAAPAVPQATPEPAVRGAQSAISSAMSDLVPRLAERFRNAAPGEDAGHVIMAETKRLCEQLRSQTRPTKPHHNRKHRLA